MLRRLAGWHPSIIEIALTRRAITTVYHEPEPRPLKVRNRSLIQQNGLRGRQDHGDQTPWLANYHSTSILDLHAGRRLRVTTNPSVEQ